MKEMKRALSFLLCFVMVLGLMPWNSFAMLAEAATADDPVYVLAGSDFQHPDGTASGVTTVTNITTAIKNAGYSTMDGFLFMGDYNFGQGADSDVTALKGAVKGTFSTLTDADMVFVQGNHDAASAVAGSLSLSGENDTDHYGVYVIHEDEYSYNGGTESTIQAAAEKLEAYLYEKAENGYNKPIFVVTHVPLHFSSRTVRNGDGKYASYLFDVLNTAGAAGLNIIFLYGHDHAYGYDNYIGGHAVYLTKGDTLYIADTGSQDSCTAKTLNFTYMNAGFTGYYSDTNTYIQNTDWLTMTVFEITDDEVIVRRFNEDGVYQLKAAGSRNGQYDNENTVNYVANTKTYSSPQTLALTDVGLYTVTDTDAATDDAKKVSFTSIYNESTLGLTVTDVDEATNPLASLEDENLYVDYRAYTVNTTGYVSGNWASVAIPVPTEYAMANTKVYHVASDGTLTDMDAEIQMVGGKKMAVFLTDAFVGGTYAVAYTVETDSEAWLAGWTDVNKTLYTYTLDTDGVNVGQDYKYLIVGYYDDGTGDDFALTANGPNTGAVAVNLSGSTITTDTNAYEWYITTGITNTNSSTYRYFITQNGTTWLYHTGGYMYVGNGGDAHRGYWALNSGSQGNGLYKFYDADGSDWYLRYSASNVRFSVRTDTNTYVRLFRLTNTTTSTGFVKLTGPMIYDVAFGTNAAGALTAVQTGLTATKADDANGTNATTMDAGALTWTWVDTYDGNTPGTYKLAISYNGFELGLVEVNVPVPSNIDQWVTITETSSGTDYYTYTLDEDGVNTDSGYLIVGSEDAAAMNFSSSNTNTQPAVSVTVSSDEKTVMTGEPVYEWMIDSSNRIYKTVGSTKYYLKLDHTYENYRAQSYLNWTTSASEATAWTITRTSGGEYRIYATYTYGSIYTRTAYAFLYYNGTVFGMTTQDSVNSGSTVRLYGGRQDPAPSTETVTKAKAEGPDVFEVRLNTTADQALTAVKGGISVYTSTDNGVTKTLVDDNDSDIEWTWVDTYDGSTPGYYTVQISYDGKSLGTVEVLVNDIPAGSTDTWVSLSGIYKYVLDTDGADLDDNGTYKYMFVASDAEIAMNAGADSSVVVEIVDETTLYTDTRANEWHIRESGRIVNNDGGSPYHAGYALHIDENTGSYWTIVGNGDGTYRFHNTDENDTWNLHYDAGEQDFRVVANDSVVIRLYRYDGNANLTGYAMISGDDLYRVNVGTSKEIALKAVQEGITGYLSTSGTLEGATEIDDNAMTWTWLDEYDPETEGYYTVQISYMGKVLGTVEVEVYEKPVSGYELSGSEGYVAQNASQYAPVLDMETGEPITVTVTYTDGTKEVVTLTVEMLNSAESEVVSTAEIGTFKPLDVDYDGFNLSNDFTLHVIRDEDGYDFPEYPDGGSVVVNKTADSTNLLNTGVVNVELSTSGLSTTNGMDIVIVVDTSSSMTNSSNNIDTDGDGTADSTRLRVMQDSLAQMLKDFAAADPDTGEIPDIEIAVVDFNGYIGGGNAVIEGASLTGDSWSTTDYSKVYTGSGKLDADAFVKNTDVANEKSQYYLDAAADGTFITHQGTDYDDGLYNAYMLLSAKAKANAMEGVERDQFVIFLSDGAPFSYNGYNEQGSYYWWNEWLAGTYDSAAQLEAAMIAQTGDHHYDASAIPNEFPWFYNGPGNPNRWAQALKGSQEEYYQVVGEDFGETGYYLTDVLGMDATIYSIGFGIKADGDVELPTVQKVLKDISSGDVETGYANGTQYYYEAQTADQLDEAFSQIVSNIKVAATDAYFVDQMGQKFDLQMASTIKTMDADGKDVTVDLVTEMGQAPSITITTYKVYTQTEADKIAEGSANDDVTNAMVGQRKPDGTVLEIVTFNDAGTQAYSTVDTDGDGDASDETTSTTNILTDNVIRAKYFYYNAGDTAVNVTLPDGSTFSLAPETFCWNIGDINNNEFVLDYYVYLNGSMEGTAAAGSYETNEYATLYYENWLGHDVYQDTVSPSVGWKAANVSYGFYLVNADGEPVVNQTTGATGNFTNAVKVTSPVVYQEILLNNLEDIDTIEAASLSILPPGYTLYDASASYKIVILSSDGKGSWTITSDKEKQTTYVTGFSGTNSSNETKVAGTALDGYTVHTDYDYTHTTVWFAVLWIPSTIPDTVVVDFGLPVDISVLGNDQFGTNGKLLSVGLAKPTDMGTSIYKTAVTTDGFASAVQGTYGTAEVNGSDVRYTPGGKIVDGKVTVPAGSMEMPSYDKFVYQVEYNATVVNNGEATNEQRYFFGDITVVPATTIYYEDEFLALSYYDTEGTNDLGDDTPVEDGWEPVGETVEGATQDEDRPGQYSLPAVDANNVYGFDSAYTNMSKYSLGSAMMAHVDANSYARAEFSFYGTGFDVISLTSNATGTLVVQVYPYGSPTAAKTVLVDTYFGYTYGLYNVTYTYTDGKWVRAVGTAVTGTTETKADLPEKPNEGHTETGVEYCWVVTNSTDPNAIYQVPVIQVEDLTYGRYEVVITATYNSYLDHTSDAGYDLYLDAIRIYDPAGVTSGDLSDPVIDNDGDGVADEGDTTIEDVYEQDNEGWPLYQELRDNIILAAGVTVSEPDANGNVTVTFPVDDTFSNSVLEGAMFIDGNDMNASISDYVNYGPNNELYLEGDQSIAFMLDLSSYYTWVLNKAGTDYYKQSIIADVQIGLKSADGSTITAQISNVGSTARATTAVQKTFASTTDMYYSIIQHVGDPLNNANDVILLQNISDSGILSITNIKITFTQEPVQNPAKPAVPSGEDTVDVQSDGTVESETNNAAPTNLLYMTEEAAGWTLTALRNAASEATQPEETVPEETEPEQTVPEETEPEETEEPGFVPEKLNVHVSRTTAKVGNNIIVTVRTSADVTALTINGRDVPRSTYSHWSHTSTWIIIVRLEEVGELDLNVVGYDAEGNASEPVTCTVTVSEKTESIWEGLVGGGIFG